MKSRKILILIESMSGGGAERVVMEILNNIDRSRFTPILALFRKEGPYLSNLINTTIYEIPGCDSGYRKVFTTTKKLRILIQTIKPDLILSHLTGVNLTLLRVIFIFGLSYPVIITEHNNFSAYLKRLNSFRSLLLKLEAKFFFQRATKIIVVSKGIKQNLIDVLKIKEDTIKVINNPVNIHQIKQVLTLSNGGKNRVKNIISIGRLCMQKGFSDLITAFSEVVKVIPSKLTILGEGSLRSELELKIRDLKLEKYVDMPGFVSPPWPMIRDADVFVLSSRWEGFGNVIIEAMACDTPVISTDCNYGPNEIIDDKQNGLLVPVGNIKALSNAIIDILSNEQVAKLYSTIAKDRLGRFDSRNIVRKYEQIFDEVINSC